MSKTEEFAGVADRAHHLHGRVEWDSVPGDFVRAERAFASFCWDNSALIARALRRDEAIEEPSDVLIAFCGDAVTEAMTEGRLKGYSLARVALVAFREAVK